MDDQIFTFDIEERILSDYRCSQCWGHLISKTFDASKRLVEINCPKCGNVGIISAYAVNNAKSKDAGLALEARYNLQKAGIIDNPNSGKSRDELLKELGF